MAKAPAPVQTTPPPMTTAQGYAIQILGFIPIPKNDLRRQIEVSQLLMDVNDGKKTAAELVPHMKQIEYRQQHVGKRITVEEARAWNAPLTDKRPDNEEGNNGDQSSDGDGE